MAAWTDLAEVDAYLLSRHAKYVGSGTDWGSLTDAQKESFITLGQQLIEYNNQYGNWDTDASGGVASSVMKWAVSEMAFFLARQDDDYYQRTDLLSMGVSRAGVVKEEYRGDIGHFRIDGAFVPKYVDTMLRSAGYWKYGQGFHVSVPRKPDAT